jgi:hypothetical protein
MITTIKAMAAILTHFSRRLGIIIPPVQKTVGL